MGELAGQSMTEFSVARSRLMHRFHGTRLSPASRRLPFWVRGRQRTLSAASVRSVITYPTNALWPHSNSNSNSNSNRQHTGHPDEWRLCNVYVLLGIRAPASGTSAHFAILAQHARRVTRHGTALTPCQNKNTRLHPILFQEHASSVEMQNSSVVLLLGHCCSCQFVRVGRVTGEVQTCTTFFHNSFKINKSK